MGYYPFQSTGKPSNHLTLTVYVAEGITCIYILGPSTRQQQFSKINGFLLNDIILPKSWHSLPDTVCYTIDSQLGLIRIYLITLLAYTKHPAQETMCNFNSF